VSPAEEIRAAAARKRATGDPEDAALADLLDQWAWLGRTDPDLLNRTGGPEALRLARLINQPTPKESR
jgi:hypothetical protein